MMSFDRILSTVLSKIHKMTSKIVVAALSGGVDSAVAAYLLKKSNYQVYGIYMRNWDHLEEGRTCSSDQDWSDVQQVGKALDIPVQRVDFSREYWIQVVIFALI